jgi:N-acetylglucosaminyl-diphospho-decaprenol L-rhamnosyltransferase
MSLVDAVVVSYNSRESLAACVTPLAGLDDVQVIVVDNASTDGSLEAVRDLPVVAIRRSVNAGFAAGCNAGWRAGSAPYVLLLNPDATIAPEGLRRLVRVLEEDESVGAVAPRIEEADGSLHFSQRRFQRLRSTYARAFFLHRLAPAASWADEVVRDEERYSQTGSPEWASGACLLVRRSALEEIEGLDEGFFLYCEDDDLCRRLWQAGHAVHYDPEAVCTHQGGASAPRSSLLPLLAASRIRYAQKHRSPAGAGLERIGVMLNGLTHALVARGGIAARAGHARSIRVAVSRQPRTVALAVSGLSAGALAFPDHATDKGAPGAAQGA